MELLPWGEPSLCSQIVVVAAKVTDEAAICGEQNSVLRKILLVRKKTWELNIIENTCGRSASQTSLLSW